jgi:hypothetical protein
MYLCMMCRLVCEQPLKLLHKAVYTISGYSARITAYQQGADGIILIKGYIPATCTRYEHTCNTMYTLHTVGQ